MKIRMLAGIGGTFHNDRNGVNRGDIVDIDEHNAKRYISSGLASATLKGEMPMAYTSTQEAVAMRGELEREGARQ